MSERKNKNTFAYFIKKNLYYLVTGISLLIIAAVITVVLVTNKKPIEGNKPDSVPGSPLRQTSRKLPTNPRISPTKRANRKNPQIPTHPTIRKTNREKLPIIK